MESGWKVSLARNEINALIFNWRWSQAKLRFDVKLGTFTVEQIIMSYFL